MRATLGKSSCQAESHQLQERKYYNTNNIMKPLYSALGVYKGHYQACILKVFTYSFMRKKYLKFI